MHPTVTLVVLASEDRARFLESAGPGRGLIEIEAVAGLPRPAPDDREGRVAAGGGAHHGLEPRTLPDEAHRAAFSRHIVAALVARVATHPVDALVLSAPAKMLGLLRADLPDTLRAMVVADQPRDLVTVSAHDLPSHFPGVRL